MDQVAVPSIFKLWCCPELYRQTDRQSKSNMEYIPIGRTKQVHQKNYLSIFKKCYKNKYSFLTTFLKWFPAIIKYIEVDNLTYAYTSKLL